VPLPELPEVSIIPDFLAPEECQMFLQNVEYDTTIDTGDVSGYG
jgi:hypothetical protein